MINALLAYDNADNDLGAFFESCALYSKEIFDNIVHFHELDTELLDKPNIERTISSYNESPFLCIAFSHGLSDALIQSDERYICTENAYFFGSSLVYTFACHASNELGEALINHGCHAFIGYNKEAWCLISYENISKDCACFALECLKNGDSLGLAVRKMQDRYTFYIDVFEDLGDFIIGSYLRHNRDSLILLGNKDMMLSDLDF
jgi:hypothetical protein